MKKITPFIFLILSLMAIFILILNKNEKQTTKLITINTLHSYLYSSEQRIEIPIFVTGEKTIIKEIESYNTAFIINDEGKKLQLDLNEITAGHTERYLNEIYTKYILKFNMPNLTENFYINDASLNLTFINNFEITLKIGDFHLAYINNNTDLNWQSIDSKRLLENNDKLQMDYIVVTFEATPINIESIHIDTINSLNYEIINNELYIEIAEKNMLVNYIPLWIKLSNNEYITFNNHHYSIEYSLLNKVGREMNIYVLD